MSAIYILWLRELKRYVRSRAQIVASLGQPLLYLLVLGFGLGPVFQKAGNGSYLQFVAPGVISMTILFTAIFSGIAMLWDRQFGFLKETLVAPVPRIEVMIGRTLGGATVAVIQGTLILIVCLIAGFRPAQLSLFPLAFLFMALIAIVFAALGTAFGSIVQDMQGFQLIMNFMVLPIFFLSGALFPLSNLPKAADYHHPARSPDVWRRRFARSAYQFFALRHCVRRFSAGSDRGGFSFAGRVFVFPDSAVNDSAEMARTGNPFGKMYEGTRYEQSRLQSASSNPLADWPAEQKCLGIFTLTADFERTRILVPGTVGRFRVGFTPQLQLI